MTEARTLLISALEEKRPLVLVLGQDAWRENGLEDPVLAQALAYLQREGNGQRGWLDLFGAAPLEPSFYEWLSERFIRRVPPEWLTVLGEIPWSAIFTSTLDPSVKDLFTRHQRPELVLTNAEMPPAIRSRIRPPIYHLFGHADSPDPRACPPLDRNQLNTRRVTDALPLFNRILDTTTKLGLVLIDGLVTERDWLQIEDVLGAIGNASAHQVLWFKGHSASLPANEGFNEAVSASRIIIVNERLSTAIAELRAVKRIADLMAPESEDIGKITFEDGKFQDVSPEERLHVEAVASIVDDAWTAPLPALGPRAEYAAFRKFHGESGNARALVEGVRRGFSIERDYEKRLLDTVCSAIRDHARFDTPIILHGQSATGKSIALARVAARVREGKLASVLYSNNRIPQPSEIAQFCHSAEGAGAKATLIVCDTNQDVRQHFDLLSGLRSRGHRVVVLGSRYRFIDSKDDGLRATIEAPVELTDRERNALSTMLERFAGEKLDPKDLINSNILAFLYRALPLVRYRIGTSLSAEATHTERMVRQQGQHYKVNRQPTTLMAQRLIEAGIDDSYENLFSSDQVKAIESDDNAGRAIDLVMVAGSLNCSVPFNLLLRIVSSRSSLDLANVFDIFGGLDLFRWEWADNEHNELLVKPRLALEAELICRRRLGSAEKEAQRIIDLIGAIRSVGVEREHELRFLFNILHRIGPNGPRRTRYREMYADIGRTLTELRTRFGIEHPSIVLQESAFRRHAVRKNAVEHGLKIELLAEARDAVQSAIDSMAVGSIRASKRTQRFLRVELASLYGFIAYSQAEAQHSNDEIWSSYLATRSSIRQAVSVTDSYFPLDVGLWTPTDLLQKCEMSEQQKAELTADIYDILDQINPDALDPEQREKFHVRMLNTGHTVGDQEVSETAFSSLVESGSTAGFYLQARNLAPVWNHETETFSTQAKARAKSAADFLDENMHLIAQDARCLSLLLECRWIAELGHRPFIGQRQPLPAAYTKRRMLLEIVRKLNEAYGEASRNVTRYLAAVLMWLTGEEKLAMEAFRNLDRETEYEDSNRVIRRHIITNKDSSPTKFSGRVERESKSGSHWIVRLEDESRQTVRVRSKDFSHVEVAYGRQLRDFGVAFNFIGPIATPLR